ncbi:MAG TPA: GNAT family N-acetyltransferase [Acidimicrobiales bacterium]|nr:GNAT family N-acetyltransferase [Acidimicrobiales bacterium]
MLEIRPPEASDRDAVAAIDSFSFNGRTRPEAVPLEGALCCFDGGRAVASATALPFEQWFGGCRARCAGVASVAVLPEYRGRGLAGRLVRQLLEERRRGGDAVSVLYPANAALYRQLGYEYAGLMPEFRMPVADLPAARGEVSEMTDADLPDIMACFARFAAQHNGPVQSGDHARWREHVLAHVGEGAHQRTVLVRGEGGVEGYASYFLGSWEGHGYPLICKHLVALAPACLRALLGHLRHFENSANSVSWRGAPSTAPVGIAARASAFSVVPEVRRWMLRVLDVGAALSSRGYGQTAGEVVIEVEDNLFPGNSGPWLLQVERGEGRATVSAARPPVKPLPIGYFSALFTGFATPWDLVLLGALDEDDPRLALLSALFGGPTPWMPDFF